MKPSKLFCLKDTMAVFTLETDNRSSKSVETVVGSIETAYLIKIPSWSILCIDQFTVVDLVPHPSSEVRLTVTLF